MWAINCPTSPDAESSIAEDTVEEVTESMENVESSKTDIMDAVEEAAEEIAAGAMMALEREIYGDER